MIREKIWNKYFIVTFFIIILTGFLGAQSSSQEVPEEARQALSERGMSVAEARQKAEQMGIDLSNPELARMQAQRKGVPESLINKWLQIYRQSKRSNDTGQVRTTGDSLAPPQQVISPKRPDSVEIESKDTTEKAGKVHYFGYEVFDQIPEAFQPSATGPVSEGYVLGPGDQLRLLVWGATEFQYDLNVDQQGRIYIPEVGQYTVSGLSLEESRKKVKKWLSRKYQGLTEDPPTIFMDLTLSRLRPIKVFVLGEVDQPGGYTLNSHASVFNALYSVGGPTTEGSLRKIKVIRNNEVIAEVDFYNYLLRGFSKNSVQLQDNDHVFIPPRGKTVKITGQVKRPAYYEVKQGETVSDLIEYAGGLKSNAYTRKFPINRIVPPEERENPSLARKTFNFNLAKILAGKEEVKLLDGDKIKIYSISEQREDYVELSGPVFQPGSYELNDTVETVQDLIKAADGLKGAAYEKYVELYRMQEDRTRKLLKLDLQKIMNTGQGDISLKSEDSLKIYSHREIDFPDSVAIGGKVRNPGKYAYKDSMQVYDLLFKGGGLLDEEFTRNVYMERAELFRRKMTGAIDTLISFSLEKALDKKGIGNEFLQPGDSIQIHGIDLEEITDKYVRIRGRVKNPGRYSLSEDMNIKDLIVEANGFAPDAYLQSLEVYRNLSHEFDKFDPQKYDRITLPMFNKSVRIDSISYDIEKPLQELDEINDFNLRHRDVVFIKRNPNYTGSSFVTITGEVKFPGQYTLLHEGEMLTEVFERAGGLMPEAYPKGARFYRDGERVVLDIGQALETDEEKYNINLFPGDSISVPKKPNTVMVRGNVGLGGYQKYQEGKNAFYYINRAGGLRDSTKNVMVTGPAGETQKLSKFLGMYVQNPDIEDGSRIVATRKSPKKREPVDIKGIVTETMALVTNALTILVLVERINN